ncbi:hypothetical protein [Pontibacter flavimaris]|nr:hypothetical protein [Pontibacter flavimaris]
MRDLYRIPDRSIALPEMTIKYSKYRIPLSGEARGGSYFVGTGRDLSAR